MQLYRLIFLFVLTLLQLDFVVAQSWQSKLDSLLVIVEKQDLFDGQILIAEKGAVLFSQAYGKNHDGQAITLQTPLSIASATKSFTALSILILADQGLLHVDDKITQYFPELTYREVTLEHLMNMTSGLPRFMPHLISNGDTTEQMRNKEVIELIARYNPPENNPAGEKFAYNNDNYVLLASVIEQVSGQSYADFVQQHIFDSLGMKNSSVLQFPDKLDQEINLSNFYAVEGAGNIYSTAEDLYLFSQALFNNQIISEDLLKAMFAPTLLKDGTQSNYGYAWRTTISDNRPERYIVGDGENTRASMQRFIDEGSTFIYIHNFSGQHWESIYDLAKKIWKQLEYEMPAKRVIHDIDPNILDKYTGQYLSKNFGLLHVTLENGKLYLRPDPIPGKEELVPSSDTTFYFANQGLEWEFFFNDQGEVHGLGIKGKPETIGPKQQ